ncbi:uracil-xanthine permease [Oribacterium sp. oral taxon 102]|uniref:uracil-xanthine permease family protein n=1 Tax=Oribacterium sp. oral taxon 102 TaxID=671214 RepID=UPI0015C11494|nr:uracil-xanthine permease family protein [Oribacterium sp. oral taxon 102]NWO20472.1 uracil-xanthine permease [Oribacterium sp. oral taxon 102]
MSEAKRKRVGDEAIYDVRELGTGHILILGLQHMFAMFGATVLVPLLTGLSVSATLLFAGLGTLLFHLISKKRIPAFLGSSFAFLAGYMTIAPHGEAELLPYACFGVACAGLVYLLLAALFRAFGAGKVMRYFPPVVTGPIIIAIGLNLSKSAIESCGSDWTIALVAIVVVIVCNIWGRGMVKIIPILLGVLASYLTAAAAGKIDFTAVRDAAWIGLPIAYRNTVFALFTSGSLNTALLITSVITILPISFATMMEHIGDISAISSTVGKNFIKDPGLHRTLTGDGLATTLASLFGAPANTTYGENTGVLTLTRVYDPAVIRLAACFAIFFSFCPKFAAVIEAMPAATIGGISLVLYGMISAVGVRNVVETKVDFSQSRNVIIAALILVLSIGINYSSAGAVGFTVFGMAIRFSGLATGSLVGILLNAILPGKDYRFEEDEPNDTGVDLQIAQGESLVWQLAKQAGQKNMVEDK